MRSITLWIDAGHGQFFTLHYTGEEKVIKEIAADFAKYIRYGNKDHAFGTYELRGANNAERTVSVDFSRILFIG